MAKFYGNPSRYLKNIEKLNLFAIISYLVILIFIWYVVFVKNLQYLFSLGGIIAIVIMFVPVAWFAYYRYKKHERELSCFRRGRKGEGKILYKLKELSDEYSVFQDVKINSNAGNIDFVVVGPGGVYALEVKSHSGKIDFNGEELTNNGRLFERKGRKGVRNLLL